MAAFGEILTSDYFQELLDITKEGINTYAGEIKKIYEKANTILTNCNYTWSVTLPNDTIDRINIKIIEKTDKLHFPNNDDNDDVINKYITDVKTLLDSNSDIKNMITKSFGIYVGLFPSDQNREKVFTISNELFYNNMVIFITSNALLLYPEYPLGEIKDVDLLSQIKAILEESLVINLKKKCSNSAGGKIKRSRITKKHKRITIKRSKRSKSTKKRRVVRRRKHNTKKY